MWVWVRVWVWVCEYQTLHILEFTWSSDRNEDFLEKEENEAHEQDKSIVEMLRVVALKWTFEPINSVTGRREDDERGAVVEDTFYANFETGLACTEERRKILAARVVGICEAHDTVIQSCYQPIYGSSEADTTLIENHKEQVYV